MLSVQVDGGGRLTGTGLNGRLQKDHGRLLSIHFKLADNKTSEGFNQPFFGPDEK